MQEKEYKHQFKFVLIRFVPNFVTEEFVNAGLILYDMTNHRIIGKVTDDIERLICIDAGENYKYFIRYAKKLIDGLQKNIKRLAKKGAIFMKDFVEKALYDATTPNSGFISFSNVKSGVTDNIEREFKELYRKFVCAGDSKIKKDDKEKKRDIALVSVNEILNNMGDLLKKKHGEIGFSYPFVDGRYKFEISFNHRDNIYLKVLSLRSRKNYAFEIQNILSAITVLSDLKREHKGHTFGGLIYFSPKYSKAAQDVEFVKLKRRFAEDNLDCIKAEKSEMLHYFNLKGLLGHP